MQTLPSCRRALGVSMVGALFALGCGDHGMAPPSSEEQSPSTLSALSSPDVIVTTTSDAADFVGGEEVGDLPGPDGVVSLREAITAANNTAGPQVIGFNIPTSDVGFDGAVFTIRPLAGLPVLSGGGTGIDGATQANFTGNTNPAGPEIVLSGSLIPGVEEVEGLRIESADNVIHHLVINAFPGPCCGGNGVDIVGEQADRNVVTGCYIGLDASGTIAVGNADNGVRIHIGATVNRIGGTGPGDRNVISGNGVAGIAIFTGENVVQGNFIGTDRTGTVGLGNGNGISITGGGSNNTVGGSGSSARNIISANGHTGVFMGGTDGTSANRIEGNYIGTDESGRHALGNVSEGIQISSHPETPDLSNDHQIIRNIVSANGVNGISLFESRNNVIQGNRIGTDVFGRPLLGNGEFGVLIISNVESGLVSSDNLIGGDDLLDGNIIAGNVDAGVLLDAENTLVRRNVIFSNGGAGVRVDARLGNTMARNSILLNGGLGIDLDGGHTGVTANDPGDGDVGPNNLQNFPVLTSAVVQGGQLRVAGTIDTPNPSTVTIEFFANPVPNPGGDPSSHGEGAVPLGALSPNRSGSFSAKLPRVASGTLISATATDGAGNTSEFAANIAVQ